MENQDHQGRQEALVHQEKVEDQDHQVLREKGAHQEHQDQMEMLGKLDPQVQKEMRAVQVKWDLLVFQDRQEFRANRDHLGQEEMQAGMVSLDYKDHKGPQETQGQQERGDFLGQQDLRVSKEGVGQ